MMPSQLHGTQMGLQPLMAAQKGEMRKFKVHLESSHRLYFCSFHQLTAAFHLLESRC